MGFELIEDGGNITLLVHDSKAGGVSEAVRMSPAKAHDIVWALHALLMIRLDGPLPVAPRAEVAKSLAQHEWELNDKQTYYLCNTCFARVPAKSHNFKHKRACVYSRLLESVRVRDCVIRS